MGKGISISFFHHEEPKGYEGSADDMRRDYAAAARKGITADHYEDTAEDRIADHAGERRMSEKKESKEDITHSPSYKPGMSAFSNPPKYSSGYGHKDSQRSGQLRLSGVSGAHRIGKR